MEFQMHSTCIRQRVRRTAPPFEETQKAWGAFTIRVVVELRGRPGSALEGHSAVSEIPNQLHFAPSGRSATHWLHFRHSRAG